MTRSNLISLLALSLLGGCASTHELAVDVFTDYAAGVEFDQVAVRVDQGPWTVTEVVPHDDLSDPAHVADYPNLTGGVYDVEVELRFRDEVLADGHSWVRLTESVLVPVPIARTCHPDTCPGSDPMATECYGGECFLPMCDPTDASCMASACSATTPCPAPDPAQCIDVICQRGACLRLPRDARCASDMFCAPESGSCEYLPGHLPPDAPMVVVTPSTTAEEITVTWNDVHVTSYSLEFAPTPAFDPATTTTMTLTERTATFTGLLGGHRYYARVHGVAPGAGVSDVASNVTLLPAPTGPSLSISQPGGSRPSSAPYWIFTPTPAGSYAYERASASAGCAYGTAQYYFVGGYTSPTRTYEPGWQDSSDSFIENVLAPYGVRYTVKARCVTADARSGETGVATACFRHSGSC